MSSEAAGWTRPHCWQDVNHSRHPAKQCKAQKYWYIPGCVKVNSYTNPALFAALAHRLYKWMARLLWQRRSLASLVTLLVLFVLIIGRPSAFVGLVIKQAISMSDQAIPRLQQHFGAATSFNVHDWPVQHFPSLADYIPPQEQRVHNAGVAAKSAAGFLVTIASRMTAGTATFVLNLFVMVYAMFFFLRDGKQIMATILHYIPLAAQDKTRMVQQFTSITRAP